MSMYLELICASETLKHEKAHVVLLLSCWITYLDDDKPIIMDFGSLCGNHKVLFKTTVKYLMKAAYNVYHNIKNRETVK